jgi:hypothetical protein
VLVSLCDVARGETVKHMEEVWLCQLRQVGSRIGLLMCGVPSYCGGPDLKDVVKNIDVKAVVLDSLMWVKV